MSRATVSPYGFAMEVEYDYSPAEGPVLWGNFPHPGCPASAAINSVKVGGVDILDMLDDEQIQRVEEAVLEFQGEPA